ncbi:hypothetical protein B484DRAFT_484157, partial [Ochromonadaceae sp. CCMP2298]
VLVGAEGQGKWKEVLRVAEEVLALAPHYRPAQVSKASALGESSPDDCKAYVEHLVCSTHHSIHALHNPHSDLSPLPAAALEWRAVPSLAPPQGPIRADLASTLKLLLRAGPELSLVYVTALKVRCLLSLKVSADEKFKAKNFRGALLAYSNAVKVSALYTVHCTLLSYSTRILHTHWTQHYPYPTHLPTLTINTHTSHHTSHHSLYTLYTHHPIHTHLTPHPIHPS